MKIDLERIHQTIRKGISKRFVQQNYHDIYQETYVILAEGENDYDRAVDLAIYKTKRAYGNPKIKGREFQSIGEMDIPEPEIKKAVFRKTPFNERKKRRIYDQLTDIDYVQAILEYYDYSFSSFISKGSVPTIQLQEQCPICSNKKCFTIYDNGVDYSNNKDRYSYYCFTENPDYKKYPRSLDGIFMLMLDKKKTTVRKEVAKIIQAL